MTVSKVWPDFITGNLRRVEFDVEDYATLTVSVVGSGGANSTGVAFGFFVSPDSEDKGDNGRWPAMLGQNNATGVMVASVTGQTITSNTVHSSYTFNVAAFKRFRFIVTAMAGGPFAIITGLSKVATAFTPIPPLATQPVSGTVGVTNTVLASNAAGLGKAEDATHASGDVGVMSLGVRQSTAVAIPTSGASDYSYILVDQEGKQIPSGQGAAEQSWRNRVTGIATTDAVLLAALGAGLKRYITDILIENNTATPLRVLIKDVSAVAFSIIVPANSTFSHSFKTPIAAAAANTAFNYAGGAATTECYITVAGYTGV